MSAQLEEKTYLKLNLGAGKSRMPGFLSVDSIPFEGLDIVADLTKPWPWDDNSTDEIHMSHVLEHFTGLERVHIFNEMHRVLVKDGTGKAVIITPHWASNRAYGDYTHQWPPVSEMLYYYINREWRKVNAPHNDIEHNPKGYTCHFDVTGGYSLHPQIIPRALEAQQFCQTFYIEARQDMHMTCVARP